MACAGNRRSHTRKQFPDAGIKGINWDVGAIGNNSYKGVLFRDLLISSGISEAEINAGLLDGKHLVATGMDVDFQGEPYSVSIPIEHALDPSNEVIIAYEMNGNRIPIDHGYPLRLVCPGTIGVRNCKWVGKIEISDEEAHSHMQRRDYKYIREMDWSKINLNDYPAINGNIPYAAIC
jgi:sulfite oxidase